MTKNQKSKPKNGAARALPKTLDDLKHDPKNTRKHNPRNIAAITSALNSVGAARSIVIDEKNTILAGNGLVESARGTKINNVRVIEADGDEIIAVRRSNLTPKQKAILAIADNRTAELAGWDTEQLIKTIEELNLDLPTIEFSEEDLETLRAQQAALFATPDDPNAQWAGMPEYSHEDQQAKYRVVVHLRSADDLLKLGKAMNVDFDVSEKASKLKSVWWPEPAEIVPYADTRYEAEKK